MRKWNYNLFSGDILRKAISDGSDAEVLSIIKRSCNELLKILMPNDKVWFEDDIEELVALLEGEKEVVLNEPYLITDEWNFESTQELVNARLTQFYDICDRCRCWVEL